MYRQENKEAAIRRVQSYLYEIHQYEGIKSPTVQDGIYGAQTRAAVSDFQRREKLSDTGAVDYETFEALKKKAKKYEAERSRDRYLYTAEGFPLQFGRSGADVEVLHALLRSLMEYKRNPLPIPRGGYYSHDTERAVGYMQDTFLLERDGIVSAELFERLENELKARQTFKISDFSDTV